MSDHDDLSSFRDDPVVSALTGPATPQELAGEAAALAAFRAAVPSSRRRRLASRLGVGGSVIGITVALSGGAAAAYTSSLPAPVQQFSHNVTRWLGPVEIPPPHHGNPKPTAVQTAPSSPAAPLASSSGTPAASSPLPHSPPQAARHDRNAPAAKHSHVTSRPSSRPKPVVGTTPVATPTPSQTPTLSTSPTATASPTPGSITISLSDTTSTPGGSVTVYGQLSTSEGDGVPGQEVWLLERQAGDPGVSQVDSATTGSDGSVTLQTPALSRSARLRLVTQDKVRSAWIAVIMRATLTASVSSDGTTSTIRIATDGAEPGDMVDIQKHVPGGWQDVAANQLDSSGGATFGVPTPAKRPAHYRAVLRRTPNHAYAATRFLVPTG